MMTPWFVMFLLAAAAPAPLHAVRLPPGIKGGLYGDIVSHSDFQVNLKPPEETTRDVETSLDALLKFEESKFKTTTAESAAAKQSMLNIEKAKIRDIVAAAFAPLLGQIDKA